MFLTVDGNEEHTDIKEEESLQEEARIEEEVERNPTSAEMDGGRSTRNL